MDRSQHSHNTTNPVSDQSHSHKPENTKQIVKIELLEML